MNKVLKAVAVLGNAAEIIIAGSVLADVIMKLRGGKKAPTSNPVVVDDNPQPETPIAA